MLDDVDERLERLARLAASQHGAASVDQAVDLGLPRSTVNGWMRSGRLIRLGTSAFTFPGHLLSWRGRLQAALLDVGPNAWVADHAAGALLGFDGFGEGPVELLVPRAQRERRTPLGVVRSTSLIAKVDVVVVDGLPCTSGAFTIIELARRGTPTELERAIGSAVRDGWTSPTFLRSRLAALRRPGRSGVRLLDELLDGPRTESWLEQRFLELLRAAGLPRPTTQEEVRTRSGRLVRLDFSWEGAPLVIEVHGHRFHSSREQMARDEQRRTELVVIGRAPVAFTNDQIVRAPTAVVRDLARLRPLTRPVPTTRTG